MNGGRVGARGGPAAVRAALAKYGVASPADERPDLLAYPRVFDAGDVVPGRSLEETHDRVSEAALALVERGLLPVAIGGGHDLTYAFVRGVARAFGPLSGLYFDAHLDVRPEVGSGMPFRALLEGGLATDLLVVGLNPLVNTREHMEYFRESGGAAVLVGERMPPPESVRAFGGGWGDGGARNGGGFVSFDLDALDGSVAPGVSAVNPSGLLVREVEGMVRHAGRCAGVRCFDVMELNPLHDQDGRTARVAAHLVLTFLRGVAERGTELGGDAGERPGGRER
jgi:arginase family enzyme